MLPITAALITNTVKQAKLIILSQSECITNREKEEVIEIFEEGGFDILSAGCPEFRSTSIFLRGRLTNLDNHPITILYQLDDMIDFFIIVELLNLMNSCAVYPSFAVGIDYFNSRWLNDPS